MHSGILFGLTVLLGHLCVCSGVKCYSCTFSTTALADKVNSNPDCDEGTNFNGANLTSHLQTTECSGKCSKTRGGMSGSRSIYRSCLTNCIQADAAGNGNWCCTTDFCNDTWRMTASLVGAIASVLAAFLFRA